MTQIEDEQNRVTAMYERLEAETDAVRARLAEPLAAEHAASLTRRLGALHAAESALCFGRIDRADGTSLHIGRCGLWVDGEPLLVDWRAEAARPFYVATPARPTGLRRRRHLRLAGRAVRGLADEILDGSAPGPDDVIGDGPLAEALSAPRTGQMRAAVTTLQTEQDAIVRSPDRGVTVVQGGPGTGKTVVALHRAAYVLFAFPAAAAQGVLVVGPDRRFLDYISQVLPSLGENDVRLTTRTGITGAEPARPEQPALARLKGRAELATGLRQAVRARRPPAAPVTLPAGRDRIELPGPVVAQALAAARGLPRNRGRAAFKEYLVAEVVRAGRRAAEADLARLDAETAELVGFDLDQAVAADLASLGLGGTVAAGPPEEEADPAAVRAALLSDPELDRAVTELWPVLTPAEVVTEFLADPAAHLMSAPGRTADVPNHRPPAAGRTADESTDRPPAARRTPDPLTRSRCTAAPAAGLTAAELAQLRRAPGAPWTTADLALLDEAAELLDGPPARVYGHVVVDEAQELTEMDWRVVVRRCPARSMTLVGDFAQAGPGSTVRGWAEALGPHVGTRFAVRTLTVNYRTTAEILDSTRDLLAAIAPEQEPARSLRRGPLPRVRLIPTTQTLDGPTADTAPADLPTADMPATDMPATDMPTAEMVATEVLAELRTQAAAHPDELRAVLAADMPATDMPATDMPTAEMVATEVLAELRTQAAAHPDELRAVLAADATSARLSCTAVAELANVVPVSAARGLEFDSVLVVLPDEIVAARPGGRRDLYVALTRATRRLCVLRPAP